MALDPLISNNLGQLAFSGLIGFVDGQAVVASVHSVIPSTIQQ